MSEALKDVLEWNEISQKFIVELKNLTLVFRGCSVELNASSMSDSTLVSFNTLASGSIESVRSKSKPSRLLLFCSLFFVCERK